MVKVKLVTRYPLSYCVDREKQEVTVDGKSGYVSVTSRADIASDKFVIESDYVNVESEVAFGKKIPTDGLILEFPIFEGAGTVLHDTSGYNNNGTIYGAVWKQLATGKWILMFDGKDDKVKVSNSPSLNSITREITILAWVFFNDPTPYNYQRVICKSESAWDSWTVWIYNDRSVLFSVPSGGTQHWIRSTKPVKYRGWSYIGCVCDGDLHIYVDLEKQTEEVGIDTIDTNTNNVYIGNLGNGFRPLNGYIGLLCVYNKALSERKVEKFYKATAPLFGIEV